MINKEATTEYDEITPIALNMAFEEHEIDGVKCFRSWIYRIQSGDLGMCLISPIDLQIHSDTIPLFTGDPIHEIATVNFCGEVFIKKNAAEWDEILTYHLQWMTEISGISQALRENIETKPRRIQVNDSATLRMEIERGFEKTNRRNYILLLAIDGSVCNHAGKATFANCCIDLERIRSTNKKGWMTAIGKDEEINIKDDILCSNYGNMATYTIDLIIKKPSQLSAYNLKTMVLDTYFNIENAEDQAYFDSTFYFEDDKLKKMSVIEFLKTVYRDGPSIHYSSLRTIDEHHGFKVDEKDTIFFLTPIKKIESFDYLDESQKSSKSTNQSCRTTAKTNSVRKLILLRARRHLSKKRYSVNTFNIWSRIPSIMKVIEWRTLMISFSADYGIELAKRYNRCTWQAFSSSSNSKRNNYETLETVGDSVLKLLTIFQLVSCSEHKTTEGKLSHLKGFMVSNDRLSYLGLLSHVNLYLRTKRSKQLWRPPFLESTKIAHCKNDIQSRCHVKQIADVYEAMIGGIFMDNYSLRSCLQFLLKTGFWFNDGDSPELTVSDLFDNNIFDKNVWMNSKEILLTNHGCYDIGIDFPFPPLDISYLDLYRLSVKDEGQSIINQAQQVREAIESLLEKEGLNDESVELNNCKIEEDLIPLFEKFVGYTFKNKQLLRRALTVSRNGMSQQDKNHVFGNNLEKLEFLGDAVFECVCISSIYKSLVTKKVEFSPSHLQSAKIFLLSNINMAKFLVMSNFDSFILIHCPFKRKQLEDVARSIRNLVKESECRSLKKFKVQIPKFIGDVWEGLAGAVLIDGGWEGFKQLFAQRLAPFISYFAENFLSMNMDFKSGALEIIKKFTHIKIEFQEEEELTVAKVIFAEKTVAEFVSAERLVAEEEAYIYIVLEYSSLNEEE